MFQLHSAPPVLSLAVLLTTRGPAATPTVGHTPTVTTAASSPVSSASPVTGADSPTAAASGDPAAATRAAVQTMQVAWAVATVGAAGNMATGTTAAVANLPPGGKVVATIPVGKDTAGYPAVGEGAIWIGPGPHVARVVRIDPQTNQIAATIPTGPGAGRVAVGAESVWATDPAGRHMLRLDPRSNPVVATTPLPLEPISAVDGDGALWVHASEAGQLLGVKPQP